MGANSGGIDWESIARGMLDYTTEFEIPSGIEVEADRISALYGRGNLKGEVTIKSGTSAISTNAFYQCIGITSLIIPSTVTQVAGFGLFECKGLTTITFPSALTKLDNYSLRNCTGLVEIILEGSNPPTLGVQVFSGCTNLAAIYVPDASVSTYQATNGWSTYASIIKGISQRPT